MRLTGIFFSALLVAGGSPEVAAQTDRRERVTASLPKYDPSVRAAKEAQAAKRIARPPVDSDVLVLPEYEVREKKLHRPNEREVLTRGERERRAMLEYARDMNALELALNRWHIPFLSASFAQRAVADQERKRFRSQMEGFAHIANVVETIDPQGAKAIRDALRRR